MPLDLGRHAGLQNLIQDAVDVLAEGRSLERRVPW